MLVRNLTQGGLFAKGVTGKKIVLPPLKVVELDGLEFPAERLKKLFGRYIHILTEKVEEPKDDVSTEPKEDLEPKKGNGDVPTADETATEEKDKDTSVEDNDTNANTEDTNNDSDDVDELVDSILEEIESEDSGEEKVAPKEAEKKPTKSSKKNTKKTSKK